MEIINIMDLLMDSGKVCCIEFTEINPLLDNKGNRMAETAFEVLSFIAKKLGTDFVPAKQFSAQGS
jgi:arginase